MEFLGLKAPLLGDGAIGEYIYSLGFPREYLASECVLKAPDLLERVYAEYLQAGAQLLTTNTFDADVEKLSKHGLGDRCKEINEKAATLARGARSAKVAGSVGPPGVGLSYAFEFHDPDKLYKIYLPQIQGLVDGGVDLIVLETQVDPRHVKVLFEIVRTVSRDVPVVASFTFGPDLLTPAGFSIDEVVKELAELPLAALGANHGVSPLQFLDIYKKLSHISRFPIWLAPNSGIARFVNGGFVFPKSPRHFARCMASCAGPRTAVLGGCCGTTPEFIKALKEELASEEKHIISVEWKPKESISVSSARPSPPALGSDLSEKKGLVVEMLPPRDGDPSRFLKRAEKLAEIPRAVVSIPDSPMGRIRTSPLLMGALVKQRFGIEPMVHFALRDRGLTRVQSDLLGLSAAGLHTLFVISGDPPSLGDYPQAAAVYDISTDETLTLMSKLAAGKDLLGRNMGRGAYFFPGCAFSYSDPDAGEKLVRRWEKGARFFITQPVYSLEALEPWQKELEEYPVVVCLMPFKNKSTALYMASEVPGIDVPDNIMKKIEEIDNEDVLSFSVDTLSDVMHGLKGLASGVYLAGPWNGIMEMARTWTSL